LICDAFLDWNWSFNTCRAKARLVNFTTMSTKLSLGGFLFWFYPLYFCQGWIVLYSSNMAALPLIKLYEKRLKFSQFFFFLKIKILRMKVVNLLECHIFQHGIFTFRTNYLKNICWSCPCTRWTYSYPAFSHCRIHTLGILMHRAVSRSSNSYASVPLKTRMEKIPESNSCLSPQKNLIALPLVYSSMC
jgi:hypothetical protein